MLNKIKNMEYQTSTSSPKRKRHRSGKFDDVDSALFEWFKGARASSMPISGIILQKKADDLAKSLGHMDFSASGSTVERFKGRHNIVSHAISGESGMVDSSVTDEWKERTLPALLKDFSPQNIFNADETGLFYKLMPSYSLNVRGETCTGGKKGKERLTFLVACRDHSGQEFYLACNMDGSEKLKLVVIGRFANPRCFKGVKSLPVTYLANKRAWMTGKLFSDWVLQLDRKFSSQSRKVLLIVDNCAAHPKLTGLKSITLAFFPPNTTSVLQPCDQGIIYNFKCKYRQRMVEHIIDSYDRKKEPGINVLVAIRYAFAAWRDVSPTVIMKCFRKSGFIAEEETMDDDDDMPLAQMIENIRDEIPLARLRTITNTDTSFNDILPAEENETITEAKNDSDIVADILGTNNDDDCQSSKDEIYLDDLPVVSKNEAIDCLHKIRTYFESNAHVEETVFKKILDIEFNLKSCKHSQTKISDFFSAK
ncbi:tigger transposable element-derived protein 6-like [Ruditapes philippinarum]|uniref:tigger transposable element-derived protein 6-like n=1 Tax=Ruditapes philippinarum TaxID=129788 RepID=UPI00295A8108|nr:tigger transposable element-derived protein 6-like [Ruditapes philippinarum]